MHLRNATTVTTALLLLAFAPGCATENGAGEPDGGDGDISVGAEDASSGGGEGDVGGDVTGDSEGTELPNQLTAGEWDDNEYFDFFLSSIGGLFSEDQQIASVDLSGRVVITVSGDDGVPLSNAILEVFDSSTTYLSAPTGSDGRLLYLPGLDGSPTDSADLQVRIIPNGAQPVVQSAPSGLDWQLTIAGAPVAPPTSLDLAFVIDATSSMADELEFVKAEVASISAAIHGQASDVAVRYGLVVYRDDGDEYSVRSFDFTSDVALFRSNLNAQSADGGGDYPEAMDKALEEMNDLGWLSSNSNAVRMAFLIADAPSHDTAAQSVLHEANRARISGIKIFSVAASGVSRRAEYLMRTASQLSLARYLFLTDDSGIGNAHEEPHIPCYQVELLNAMMIRTALSELGGSYIGIDTDDVLRTVGEYGNDGRCVIEQE